MQQNATRVVGWILLLIVAVVAMLTYRRSVSDFGIGGIGFVFGYVLYYGVRQTKDFSVHRCARDRRPLAPDWFSNVLVADLQSPEAGRKKTDAEGGSRVDLSDGR